MTTAADVRRALSGIIDPCSAATGVPLSILDMGLVRDLQVADDVVVVDLRLTSPLCHQAPYFVIEVENRVGALAGVRSVVCRTDIGLEWEPAMMDGAAVARLAAQREALDSTRRATPLPMPSTASRLASGSGGSGSL